MLKQIKIQKQLQNVDEAERRKILINSISAAFDCIIDQNIPGMFPNMFKNKKDAKKYIEEIRDGILNGTIEGNDLWNTGDNLQVDILENISYSISVKNNKGESLDSILNKIIRDKIIPGFSENQFKTKEEAENYIKEIEAGILKGTIKIDSLVNKDAKLQFNILEEANGPDGLYSISVKTISEITGSEKSFFLREFSAYTKESYLNSLKLSEAPLEDLEKTSDYFSAILDRLEALATRKALKNQIRLPENELKQIVESFGEINLDKIDDFKDRTVKLWEEVMKIQNNETEIEKIRELFNNPTFSEPNSPKGNRTVNAFEKK
jgi:hypothetical protein